MGNLEEANGDRPARVFLLAGRDRRVATGHPWVFSNEIRMDAETKGLEPGALATLHRVDGKPLGIGTFNAHSLIAFRRFSGNPQGVVDRAFVQQRLERALALRTKLFAEPFYRLIHGEADGLPGLVADRFADALVLQVGTAGMEALLPEVLAAIDDVLAPATVVLRNDGAQRSLEGLEQYVRVVTGAVDGPVEVAEGGVRFLADLVEGQKTGWFFDQRDNRAFVAGLGAGARMLDLYCHSGGFALLAAQAGASQVVAVDSSARALDLARAAAEANGLAERCTFRRGDAFAELERLAEAGERFDVVAADPPAFVKTRKELKSGLKGYAKLARLAARLVAPGGFLFVASCSHNVETGLFAEAVAKGMGQSGRSGRILRTSAAAADHPVHPRLPETAYLKAMVLELD